MRLFTKKWRYNPSKCKNLMAMATSSVIQFMQMTADDEKIRLQLEALLGVGDGDISCADELDAEESAALKGQRGPLVTEFAAQKGFSFSVDELSQVVNAFEQFQAGTIDQAEFERLVGASVPEKTPRVKRVMKYLSKTYLGY